MSVPSMADEISAAIANNVPLLIAAVTLIGGIVAAKVIKPPTYKELVDENRLLRGERTTLDEKVDQLRDDFNKFKRKHDKERNILGAGFDALYRQYGRIKARWGDGELPITDAIDRAAIDAALSLQTTAGES